MILKDAVQTDTCPSLYTAFSSAESKLW